MILNEMFDHIYCINLDSREDRWEECEAEFKKHNVFGVERFSATTAEEIQQLFNPSDIKIKLGEAALVNSHLKILNDAKEKSYKNILIFEDDVEFADTIHQSLDSIPPNWEIIYFGGNHVWGQPSPINDFVAIANRTLAMHAVGINLSVIEKMIPEINMSVPIDVTYANRLYLHNSYVMIPSQAWQRPSWSDLMGQHTDYGFLK
jgi:hypothetical protein